MGTCAISQNFISDYLIGISKIEVVLFESGYWGNIQGGTPLIVQKAIGKPYIIVVFKIMKAELGIKIGNGTPIAFKPLKENGGLYFQFTVLVLHDAIPCVCIIVPEGIGFKGRIETFQVFVEDIGGIQTEIEFAVTIQGPEIKVMVGGCLIICGKLTVVFSKILHIDPKLVKVIGDTE